MLKIEELTEEQKKYLDNPYLTCYALLTEFVKEVLEEYGTIEKLEEANKVLDLFFVLGEREHLFDIGRNAEISSSCIAAILLHNLFEDNNSWSKTLFTAREKLYDKALENKINNPNGLFQLIEGQLGYASPVPLLINPPGHPGYFISQCIYLNKNFNFTSKHGIN